MEVEVDSQGDQDSMGNRHLRRLQARLERVSAETGALKRKKKKKSACSSETLRVRSAASISCDDQEVEVIRFHSQEVEARKTHQSETVLKRKPEAPNNEFDLKKAKYEVLKFGISGFEKQKRDDAMVSLAIKLGAKPPKKEYVNYCQLKQNLAKERADAEAQRQALLKQGIKVARRRPTVAQRRKKDQNKVAGFDPMGHARFFKDGVQNVQVFQRPGGRGPRGRRR
ncbi:unnamed protein product [Cyprideis torosa]|uniref:Uncharacterized protein n=1 Tax=Cyprideis torosa TaxID=163714 RepID=A0A7R8WM50_9CRUS|nr:unnamed protein product [Cyprideis torosa]CAG0905001.1 unnamed protein product [Cyprideis torosa]